MVEVARGAKKRNSLVAPPGPARETDPRPDVPTIAAEAAPVPQRERERERMEQEPVKPLVIVPQADFMVAHGPYLLTFRKGVQTVVEPDVLANLELAGSPFTRV